MEGATRLAPTMADLWDAARTATGTSEFDALLGTVRYTATEPDPASPGNTRVRKDIELLLSHCQLAQAFSPAANIAAFIHDTEQLIVRKCAFVKDGFTLGTHETFFVVLLVAQTRFPRTRLFTTNYDLCFEQAASSAGFIVLDGFSHTLPQRFNSTYFDFDFVRRDDTLSTPDFLPNVFQLYKLHGSVDWDRRGDEVFRMTQPTTPVLIYPRDSKFELSYEPPYFGNDGPISKLTKTTEDSTPRDWFWIQRQTLDSADFVSHPVECWPSCNCCRSRTFHLD